MSDDEVAPATRRKITDIVAKQTWDAGPFTVPGMLSPYLPIAADLTESFQDTWHVFAKQSAAGQLLAVSLQEELCCKDEKWEELLIASGLWIGIRERILPQEFFPGEIIDELGSEFQKDGSFRDEVFAVSGPEPPSEYVNLERLGK